MQIQQQSEMTPTKAVLISIHLLSHDERRGCVMQLSTSLARPFAQTYSIPLRFPVAHSDCELSPSGPMKRLGLFALGSYGRLVGNDPRRPGFWLGSRVHARLIRPFVR